MELVPLKALADQHRLAIVQMLSGGERCVCELSEGLGLSEALVSHHVKRLRAAGLVKARRKGQWLHCRLNEEAFDQLAAELRTVARAQPSAASGPRAACVTVPETPTTDAADRGASR